MKDEALCIAFMAMLCWFLGIGIMWYAVSGLAAIAITLVSLGVVGNEYLRNLHDKKNGHRN